MPDSRSGAALQLPNAPDDAPFDVVLRYVEMCARSWEEEARLLGNARATDIARSVDQALHQHDVLRSALVKLVGVDGREGLEQMEAVIRLMPAPEADKAATIDAVHALIATLKNDV